MILTKQSIIGYMTYDISGNIIPCNLLSIPNINGKVEKDSNSIHDEPEGSKSKLE